MAIKRPMIRYIDAMDDSREDMIFYFLIAKIGRVRKLRPFVNSHAPTSTITINPTEMGPRKPNTQRKKMSIRLMVL